MILLFLGSWRSTIIIAISIPLAVLGAIVMLSAIGETLNIMTLGGLALAVGILVDDATVTIENINYHLYVCALAYVDPAEGIERIFTGRCGGHLSSERRGSRGFGYDPAFIPDELPPGAAPDTTMAQLSDSQKDAISHRGRAVRAFAAWLGS